MGIREHKEDLKMIQTAIDVLSDMLKNVPQDFNESRHKAKILCDFAEKFAEEILRRLGFEKDITVEEFNLLAVAISESVSESAPSDSFAILELYDVPLLLNADSNPPLAHVLFFGNERVLDWDDEANEPKNVMTYEEAARFVVFWLQIKILQICQANKWDRVNQLPDMFDRLARLLAEKPTRTPTLATELREKLGLEYDPNTLLWTFEELHKKDLISVRTRNSLNHRFAYVRNLYEFVQMPENKLHDGMFFNRNGKTTKDLLKALSDLKLRLGMKFPPQVAIWVESKNT
jgi:hypothetical protein